MPPLASTLPGNAAVSMPLRWSRGVMQISVDAALLPSGFVGQQITGIRMRRPALVGEPSYAAGQRTITVRGEFTSRSSANLVPGRANASTSIQWLAGPTPIAVPATTPPTGGQVLGDPYLVIPFAQPLAVVAGNLFLEFETSDAPFAVADQWIDAMWFVDGIESGLAVPVGDDCTSRPQPFLLRWSGAAPPTRGASASLLLTGIAAPAQPPVLALFWIGIDPMHRSPGPGFLGLGADLGIVAPALAGCRQWIPLDATLSGFSNAAGVLDINFSIPANVTAAGDQLGVQGAFLDAGRAGMPLSFSNGQVLVLDRSGIGNQCATVFFPDTAVVSPWPVEIGLMPVLVLEY